MQGIEVPIKDVCENLDHRKSKTHKRRYMPEELNQRPGEISNYRRLQTIHRHHPLELCLSHLNHNSK
jgi:hypothetical protein